MLNYPKECFNVFPAATKGNSVLLRLTNLFSIALSGRSILPPEATVIKVGL